MSDQLNKDEKTLSFKEQILRDLDALKATIEAGEVSREAKTIQEEASLLKTPERLPKSKLPGGENQLSDLQKVSETSKTPLPQELSKEDLDPSLGEASSDSSAVQIEPVSGQTVPDFVEEQARQFADMRTKIDDRLSQIDNQATLSEDKELSEEEQGTISSDHHELTDKEEAIESFNHKVPVSFNAEQVSLDAFATIKDGEKASSENEFEESSEKLADSPLKETPQPNLIGSRRRSHSQLEKKRNKAAKRIVVGVIASLVVVIGLLLVAGYFHVKGNLEPVDSKSTSYVQVEIPDGASAKEIGQILVKEGLIRDATIFNYYTKFKNYSNFQSGFHSLNKSMSVDAIVKELQKEGTATAQGPVEGKITIPEGYTLKQISEAVTVNAQSSDGKGGTPFTAEEFMSTVQDEAFINEMIAKYPTLLASLPTADSGVTYRLEGYLFPATYDYEEATTVRDLIDHMLATMDSYLSPFYEQIAAQGQTVNQVLSLASLVEKEGSSDEDRRNIASVFYNRMQIGMPLQSNIAILYAEGKLGEKTTLEEDVSINTEIDSPFNVYVNLGYMPGPVDSPSLSAIEATISPNQTTYLYFVADVTSGKVYYANTYEEHAVNVQTYVNSNVTTE